MVPASFTGRVSFGLFVLDGGTRELRRGQEPLHLTPKAFDLLSTLIEQRPRAVSKAALYERLWPNTFVDEANLAILVAEIRAALGDSARKPAFIRTGSPGSPSGRSTRQSSPATNRPNGLRSCGPSGGRSLPIRFSTGLMQQTCLLRRAL